MFKKTEILKPMFFSGRLIARSTEEEGERERERADAIGDLRATNVLLRDIACDGRMQFIKS